MFRALYAQIKRFLAWMNGGYSVKELENNQREVESRYGGGPGGHPDGYG